MWMKNKALWIYAAAYIFLLLFLIVSFYYIFSFSPEDIVIENRTNSIERSVEIIKNNIINYLGYLIGFVLSPFFVFLDICINAWCISVSLHAQGLLVTLRHLSFHGVLELPNAIFYSFLSVSACVRLFREKNFGIKSYINYVKLRKGVYLLCMLMVIIAGLIEGLIS